ncbi:ABC transporter permease [Hathewaya histolytica]|uniref:ABC transporter permease n=1 Tax=Hathewaya histolytica TaxID=1498 RepID=UPI003B676854
MNNRIIKRSLISLIVLLGISIIVFVFVNSQPGNPYIHMINPNVPPEQTETMLKNLGYYDPMPVKYLKWATRAVKGDFGYSIQYKEPVLSVINQRIWNTLLLSVIATFLSILIALPLGIISAVKKNSIWDYMITIVSFLGISIPSFFFGMLLIKWLAFDLRILPISGMKTSGENYKGIKAILDIAKHMVMPTIVLALMNTASLMRYTRSSMIDNISKDFIQTARAKGLVRKKALIKHGFRNSLIPIITILCMQIPTIFSGALITETIFIWPGIGRLNYEAVLNRDYPLIMGILMIMSVIILLSNLLADILYSLVDPRVRCGK